MGMLINCDNKKCGQSQEALLDKESNLVYCVLCGFEIKNVTPFAKNTLRSMGQFKREVKTQEAFAVKCEKCLKNCQPKLVKGKLHCGSCGELHTKLNPAMAHSIKSHLSESSNKFK